jgi:hypothetical protein
MNQITARTYVLGPETADRTVNLLLLGNGDLPPVNTLEERSRDLLSEQQPGSSAAREPPPAP